MFRRRKNDSGKNQPLPGDPLSLQKAYWNANKDEKASLLARYPEGLSWAELLRLHHLNCAELAGTDEVNKHVNSGPAFDLHVQLVERLLLPESPCRMRHALVWQGNLQGQRQPDLEGKFRNASSTHLGCLEIIRLNAHNQPKELAFVPFDDIHMVIFAGPALFRAARLIYDTGQPDEVVLVPLLYGLSWFTGNKYDTDGSMTRFVIHATQKNDNIAIGMGMGHQDFQILTVGRRGSTFGIGSAAQISTALEMVDPRFEQKCRARGIDPDQVRRRTEPSG